MVRSVLFSVFLLGILVFAIMRMQSVYEERVPVERVTRVDIYADGRMTYRTNHYSTPTLLGIGIKAANDPPEKVVLHDCSRMREFEAVIGELREQGYTSFEIELPGGC